MILWENANRFCNSPANTSTGTCTLVDPSGRPQSCSAANINRQPYYERLPLEDAERDGRTQPIRLQPSDIGPSCTPANECGFQGMFSEYGTYPAWSPYQKTIIEQQITFDQNNHFRSNTYDGPWHSWCTSRAM